tara:strand:- start:45280 stop:46605 length:1326 start_codon:yes stop_codon:yes gene_type:complete
MMPSDPNILAPLAWLGTYLVHSTILLGLAALLTRRELRARTVEWIWKSALVGSLATATLQTSLGLDPLGAQIALGGVAEPVTVTTSLPVHALPGPTTIAPTQVVPTVVAQAWPAFALWAWVVGGALGAVLLLVATRRLQIRLRGIEDIESGPMLATLEHLRRRAGMRRRVRLAVCPSLDSPIALGVWRPTIVLPPRAVRDLPPRMQAPMLAHELAHVARFDPFWLDVCRLLECVVFLQPLHRMARRHLARCAEFRCDDWAVRETGDRIALARCLTEVAGWLGRSTPLPACGMADLRSPLAERVRRILDASPTPDQRPVGVAAIAPALIAATVLWAPGFAVAESAPDVPNLERLRLLEATEQARTEVDAITELLVLTRHEVRSFEGRIADLRAETERRQVPAATLAQLERLQQRIANLETRHEQITRLHAQLTELRAELRTR